MAGLVPAIHVFGSTKQVVDARVKPGHDEWRHTLSFPRRVLAQVLSIRCSLWIRGRRESRALDAPAAPCAMVVKEGTRIRQVQPRHPGFPRAMVLRLIRALPGEAAFLAPVAGGNSAGVAPGSRRQDHTISPYAAAFRPRNFALTPQRPSPPAPTCRDDHDTPLGRHGMDDKIILIYVIVKRHF